MYMDCRIVPSPSVPGGSLKRMEQDNESSDAPAVDQQDVELFDLLRLNLVPGIGPRMQRSLLDRFDTAGAVLSANINELRQAPRIGAKLAQAIAQSDNTDAAQREWDRCEQLGIRLIGRHHDAYPRMLTEIFAPPNVLYCRGNIEPRDELAVGIVGSRRCTHYGRQQAERLAGALARAGMTVISRLARGIDAVAHRAALAAGGRTIAVMASGVKTIYPPEHAELAEQVAQQGAVVSECSLEQQPTPGLFPQRNRIISGMSLGVIIIEASRNSGALHTARHAMEQGREVLAVPGRVDSLASEGCHDLIRDGVGLVRNVDDVLEALGPLIEPLRVDATETVHSPRELTLNDQERAILNLVTIDSQHIDELLRSTAIEASRVLSTLTVLEMKRMVRRLPGGYYVRAN
jgi:DNA processing protein